MAAYLIAHVDIKDWDAYREYMQHTPRVIHKFGGRFIARGAEPLTLEGPEETLRIVVIEFPSIEQAKAFYNSKEYIEVKKLRDGAGAAKFVVIDGYPIDQWEAAVQQSTELAPRA